MNRFYISAVGAVLSLSACDKADDASSIVGVWHVEDRSNKQEGEIFAGKTLEFKSDGQFEGHLYNSGGFFLVQGKWRKDGSDHVLNFKREGITLERRLTLSSRLVDLWHPPYDKVEYAKE